MQPISRANEGLLEVFDADLEPVLSVPIAEPFVDHAVSPSLDRLAYLTRTDVVCLAPDGRQLWRFALGARGGAPSATFSLDGRLLWVYSPDAMAGRADTDRWVALDAVTGEPRVEHRLRTAGQGGEVMTVPGGQDVLLDVGEGQDGSVIFRATGEDLQRYPFDDRVLIAVSPDGSQFMTVHHEQEDVAFHAYPGGEIQARVNVDRIVIDPAETFVEWTGGYLDAATAVVVVGGEDENEQEWWSHYRIDAHTGEVLGPLRVDTVDAYDLRPLGDGSYLVTDTDGTLRRL